jgi:hypothetical protein
MIFLEIGLAVFGFVTLIRGKMVLSATKVVEGVPAYLLGLLAICPLPIVIVGGFTYGVMKGMEGKQDEIQKIL